jgi:hypothetical protein
MKVERELDCSGSRFRGSDACVVNEGYCEVSLKFI